MRGAAKLYPGYCVLTGDMLIISAATSYNFSRLFGLQYCKLSCVSSEIIGEHPCPFEHFGNREKVLQETM